MTDELEFACGIPADGDYWGQGTVSDAEGLIFAEALVEMVKSRFPATVELQHSWWDATEGYPTFWVWAPADQCEAVSQWVDEHWGDAVEMVLRREADQS